MNKGFIFLCLLVVASLVQAAPSPSAGRSNNVRSGDVRGGNVTAQFVSAASTAPTQGERRILSFLPRLDKTRGGRYIAIDPLSEEVLHLTPLVGLQRRLETIINGVRAPHVAAVVMQPDTGRILAVAGKSNTIADVRVHAGFPAASLFKILTAVATAYDSDVSEATEVVFRGGNYTLNQYNYRPNAKTDRRKMTISEAMGKSINPVFGRLALGLHSPAILRDISMLFRFGTVIPSDFRFPVSHAYIPNDDYQLSLTGAGFGQVQISPIHAAALMSTIANGGAFPSPRIVDFSQFNGKSFDWGNKRSNRAVIDKEVADLVLKMMLSTTKTGTAKSAFYSRSGKRFLPFDVAGKTGTLTGKNPKGLTKWFIAAGPVPNPRIVVSVVVVDPRYRSESPTYLGKRIFDQLATSVS